MSNQVRYLTGPQLRKRYAWSTMTQWRREQESDFPKPIIDGRRKLYALHEIEAWERARKGLKIAAPCSRVPDLASDAHVEKYELS